ncbi:hypothetical protein BH09PAT1_BH09PAT1_8800 [soil metagenome]
MKTLLNIFCGSMFLAVIAWVAKAVNWLDGSKSKFELISASIFTFISVVSLVVVILKKGWRIAP